MTEGKKIVVNMSYGVFSADPHEKFVVSSTNRTFGYPQETLKLVASLDTQLQQRFEWKTGGLVVAGQSHTVELSAERPDGQEPLLFTFTAQIVKKASTRARVGEPCGGTSAVTCAEGAECVMPSGSAKGSCRAVFRGAALGRFCGGIANVRCADGLECGYDGRYADAGGKCRAIP
jgi:hypothetical protein